MPGALRGASGESSRCFRGALDVSRAFKVQRLGDASQTLGALTGASEVPHEPGGSLSRVFEVS